MTRDEEINKLLKLCEQELMKGKDVEDILFLLRKYSDRKTMSIKVVSRLLDIPIGKAKALVHNSSTWSDVKRRDEDLEQIFVDAVIKANDETD